MSAPVKSYSIQGGLGHNRFIVISEKITNGSVKKDKYTVDLKHNTCTCPHHTHRSTSTVFIECAHLAFVRQRQLDMKIKNSAHKHLVDKGLKIKRVNKVTITVKKMAVVTYELTNGGKGCTFFNYRKLINMGYFLFNKRTPNSWLVHTENTFIGEVVQLPTGWVVKNLEGNNLNIASHGCLYDILLSNNIPKLLYTAQNEINALRQKIHALVH